jgi:hypothetical protein
VNRFNDVEPDDELQVCSVWDDEPLEFEEFRLAKIAARDANEPLGHPSGDERRPGKD